MKTIRDVAFQAGVGTATVSRVLNNSGYVDAETRKKVLAAIENLGYRRNVNWSRLASKDSKTLVFLLGNRETMNSMQMRLLVSCERVLQERGYDLIFSRVQYGPEEHYRTVILPRILSQTGAVDGVVLVGLHYPNMLSALRDRNLPCAMLGNNFRGPASALEHNAVLYDDESGVFEATQYLIRLKHRAIAFVGNTTRPWFARRCEGYTRAMEAHRLKPMLVSDDWRVGNLDYGQLAAADLLRRDTPPTAIMAANDELAAGVWKELVKRQVSIPDRMSLVGFGDRTEFSILEPSLTTVSVFEDQLGEQLGLMLLHLLKAGNKRKLRSETYPCKLTERHSSAPYREPATPIRLRPANTSAL